MVRAVRALVVFALLAFVSCADFAEAELEYCFEHPDVCPIIVRDAGVDGGTDGGTDGGP